MNEFKIGDAVERIVGSWAGMKIGDRDIVVNVKSNEVRLKNYSTYPHSMKSLTKVESTAVIDDYTMY